jgi:hypothetical protein
VVPSPAITCFKYLVLFFGKLLVRRSRFSKKEEEIDLSEGVRKKYPSQGVSVTSGKIFSKNSSF